MKCFCHVLKKIGFMLMFTSVFATALVAMIAAALATQKSLGLPEPIGFLFFLFYFVIALGATIGVVECRRGLA